MTSWNLNHLSNEDYSRTAELPAGGKEELFRIWHQRNLGHDCQLSCPVRVIHGLSNNLVQLEYLTLYHLI